MKCRCSLTGSARPRSGGRQGGLSQSARVRVPVSGGGLPRERCGFVTDLAAVVRAAAQAADKPVPEGVRPSEVQDAHRSLAGALTAGTRRAVMLGTLAQRHPAYSRAEVAGRRARGPDRRALRTHHRGAQRGRRLSGRSGAAPRAGRSCGGEARPAGARDARGEAQGLRAVRRHRPGATISGKAAGAGGGRSWSSRPPRICHAALRDVAHVVLPIGSFAESAGTFVNIEGRWQSWPGAARLLGESRPGWKVLRVLANLLSIPAVDYVSCEEIRDVLKEACGAGWPRALPAPVPAAPRSRARRYLPGAWVDIPPYQGDALVQRDRKRWPRQRTGAWPADVI